MTRSPTVVIIGARADDEALLRRQLDGAFEVQGAESDVRQGLELVRKASPSIALLYLDHSREAILGLSGKIARLAGTAPVIVSRDRNPDNILFAMRAGAKDFAYLEPDGLDVRRVALNLSLAPEAQAGGATAGLLLAVFSCKGGSGATTIATNLAASLMRHTADNQGDNGHAKNGPGSVVLLDLDLQMGDVLTFLDLSSRYTWRDLVQNLHRLDDELLHQSLTVHRNGLRIVAQADALSEADAVDAKAIAGALAFLRRHFEFAVMDGLRSFGEVPLVALDMADKILVTMTQDIPALKNASRCLAIFRQLGYGRDKVKIILNRHHKRGELNVDTIADALGAPVDAMIANDFPTVLKAMNEGTILVDADSRSSVARDIRALVPLVRGEPRRARPGLLARLGGGR